MNPGFSSTYSSPLGKSSLNVSIGSLPSPKELDNLKSNAVKNLINVSAVALVTLYPTYRFDGFSIAEFSFPDIFSAKASALDNSQIDQISSAHLYTKITQHDERASFLEAVRTVTSSLRRQEPTYLFCHRGIGRSPTVALAAFCCALDLPLQQSIKLTKTIRPAAKLSTISVAATRYALMHLANVHCKNSDDEYK